MTDQTAKSLSDTIDRLYVINLLSRPDRRREILEELRRAGVREGDPLLEVFPAVRPETAGRFPSAGAQGCFRSHLEVLRLAQTAGHRAILILEDDAAIAPGYEDRLADILAELDGTEWSVAYPGYRIAAEEMPGPEAQRTDTWRALPPQTGVQTTHAMVIHQRAFAPLTGYLERMMARPAGDPAGGPMHVDGAYSWFRRDHPEHASFVTPQPVVGQRASKSDIAPPSWKDSLPFAGLLRRLRNRLSHRG